MKVTVTQFSDGTPDAEWRALVDHVAAAGSELVLLGEMPFAAWLAGSEGRDADLWQAAVDSHDSWIGRLGELGDIIVAGSRPVNKDGRPHNEAFLWARDVGYQATHLKYYLPNEPGFWEATWYRPSPEKSFRAWRADEHVTGFMICTDMWFTEHARSYAAQGVELLLVPRATEGRTGAKWLAGGRAAAVMSGAFCLSSNRSGLAQGILFGGTGWIIGPNGDVLATTTDEDPFVTLEVDLELARAAKGTYPRYIEE